MFKTTPKQNPPVWTSHKSWGWLQLQGLLGGELHDPTNIIVMQKPLEKRFDAWDWTIIPEGPDDSRVSCKSLPTVSTTKVAIVYHICLQILAHRISYYCVCFVCNFP
jgi:hypothetical protein